MLAPALSLTKAKEELSRIYELSCRENNINLLWRSQRRGFYWPEMARHAAEMQLAYKLYQECREIFIKIGDLRQPFLEILLHSLLPSKRSNAMTIKRVL